MSLVDLKTKLCSEYLALSNQMQTTSQAMQAYVRGLAAAPSHDKTLKELAALPYLPVQPSEGTFVDAYLEGEGKSKKRPRKSEATAAGGAPKEKKPKKIKDPNAPKRPASGFIMFQNTRRAAVKEEHANLDYKGQMALISEEWKTMDPAEKAEWNAKSKVQMETWKTDNAAYEESKKHGSPAPGTPDAESDNDSSEEDKKVVKKSAKQASATTSESGSGEDDSSSDDEAPSKKKAKHSTPPVSKASASKPKSSKKTK